MLKSFEIDVSPGMGIYRHHQNYPYSVQTALAEFIDNSIQSYIDNQNAISIVDKKKNNLKIKISIKNDKKEIKITDNAGGISRKNFKKAMKLGSDDKYPEESLSKFGLGMKTAATWFSDKWKIETSGLSSSDKLTSEFDLDELEKNKETKISVFVDKEKEKSHYTKITIINSLRIKPKEYYEEKVISHLLETFIKFKKFLKIEIEYDGEIIKNKRKGKIKKAYFKPFDILHYPILRKDRTPINNNIIKKWKRKIELNYTDGRRVKGYFIIMKEGSYLQPSIRLFRNRRVIEGTILKPNRPEIIFGTGVNKYAGFRLYGEFHLQKFDLDFMKTKFINIDHLYFDLKKELQKEPNFIHQLNRLRKTDIQKEKFIDNEEKEDKNSFDEEKKKNLKFRKLNRAIRKTPKILTNITKIKKSDKILSLLLLLQHKKLNDLYKSLYTISLVEHPYISYLGSCVFLECLASYMGNPGNNSFESFLKSKSTKFYPDKKNPGKKKAVQKIIGHINSTTNDIKHYHERQIVDARQLNKDFKVLEEFIIKCIESIEGK